MKGRVSVEVQRVTDAPGLPGDEAFTAWAAAALPVDTPPAELLIRLVDEAESRDLNANYRGKDKATNVLSFPAGLDQATAQLLESSGAPVPLGDLVICAGVVQREAQDQGKPLESHWAHLVVHGVLHLLGFDHQDDAEAERMEAHEREILAGLGYPDPYAPC